MLAKTSAAFKAAGVGEAEAQAAAEELAEFEGRFTAEVSRLRESFDDHVSGMRGDMTGLRESFREDLSGMRGDIAGLRSDVSGIKGQLTVLIWALGANTAAIIAILGVLLRH